MTTEGDPMDDLVEKVRDLVRRKEAPNFLGAVRLMAEEPGPVGDWTRRWLDRAEQP